MTISNLRAIISWIVLVSHVSTIFATPYFLIEFSKAIDVILILMPLTGLYLGVIINFYVAAPDDRDKQKVSKNFSAIAIFLCAVFCLAILGVQYLYHQGTVTTLEDLRRASGVIDTGLGVYSGIMIKALFRSPESAAGEDLMPADGQPKLGS